MTATRVRRRGHTSTSTQALNRARWAGVLSFRAYGLRIAIRASDRHLLDLLPDRLPFGWIPTSSQEVDQLYSLIAAGETAGGKRRRFNLLYGNGTRHLCSESLDETLDRLEADLQLYVAERARSRVFLHAGVVGWQGQAIVVPGRSFTGKSTLVAALVRAGATYYSDEYAVLDRSGRVHPFARPLSIREEASTVRRKQAVETFGGHAGSEPLPVGLVLVSRYRMGAQWRPRRLTPGQGVLELLDHAVPAQRRPRAVLATLVAVVAGAPVLKGVRGEAQDMLPALLARFDRWNHSAKMSS
jgi:hypothetical protein